MQKWLRKCGWWLAVVVPGLSACAFPQRVAFHSFSYDARDDNWFETIDLLAFCYCSKDYKMDGSIDDPNDLVLNASRTRLPPFDNTHGYIPVGEYLYVKWRVKETGEVLSERVDLRPILPYDMDHHTVTFVIDGRQLYVYLVTPKYGPGYPIKKLRTALSESSLTYELFPNNTYPLN